MAEVTTLVHDGTRHFKMRLEPILEDGKPTGHYIEIDKEPVVVDGIFDDEKVLDEVMEFINKLHEQCQSPYYAFEVEKHYSDLPRDQVYLFSSYGLNPEYESLGEAVVMFMSDMDWVVESYDTTSFTYNGETIETIYFKFNSDNGKSYWNDNVYLFPINATTFNFM